MVPPGVRFAEFAAARLETRTKESTHNRKYVGAILTCTVNVTVVICATPFDQYSWREV